MRFADESHDEEEDHNRSPAKKSDGEEVSTIRLRDKSPISSSSVDSARITQPGGSQPWRNVPIGVMLDRACRQWPDLKLSRLPKHGPTPLPKFCLLLALFVCRRNKRRNCVSSFRKSYYSSISPAIQPDRSNRIVSARLPTNITNHGVLPLWEGVLFSVGALA
jgi:hypothetical protein